LPGAAPIVKTVNISPAQPFSEAIPLPAGAPNRNDVSVTLVNTQGKTVYEYRGQVGLK
jgi:hypothetical protein